MKQRNGMKNIVYKMLSVVLVIALMTGFGLMPTKKSQAKGKTIRKEVVLQENWSWRCGAIEWKSTNPEVATGSGSNICALTAGKATLTGKDLYNNDKYIVKLTVIKPIQLQIKKVQKTKKEVKFTIKNLNKKTITFNKKVYFPDAIEVVVGRDGKLNKKVSIRPQETATITATADDKDYTFKGNPSFKNTNAEVIYDGYTLSTILYSKPTKNTGKVGKTFLTSSTLYDLYEVGDTETICVMYNKKKVIWSIVSGSDNVKILKESNHYVTVERIGNGEAEIQAKIGNKKYTITVPDNR